MIRFQGFLVRLFQTSHEIFWIFSRFIVFHDLLEEQLNHLQSSAKWGQSSLGITHDIGHNFDILNWYSNTRKSYIKKKVLVNTSTTPSQPQKRLCGDWSFRFSLLLQNYVLKCRTIFPIREILLGQFLEEIIHQNCNTRLCRFSMSFTHVDVWLQVVLDRCEELAKIVWYNVCEIVICHKGALNE